MKYEDINEYSDYNYQLLNISDGSVHRVKVYAKYPRSPHDLVDICYPDGSVGLAYAAELTPVDIRP